MNITNRKHFSNQRVRVYGVEFYASGTRKEVTDFEMHAVSSTDINLSEIRIKGNPQNLTGVLSTSVVDVIQYRLSGQFEFDDSMTKSLEKKVTNRLLTIEDQLARLDERAIEDPESNRIYDLRLERVELEEELEDIKRQAVGGEL